MVILLSPWGHLQGSWGTWALTPGNLICFPSVLYKYRVCHVENIRKLCPTRLTNFLNELCISQRSPKKKKQERFIMEIDSSDYGDLAVLQYAVCKLENQERNWCSSVQDQRPEKAEGGVGCTGVRPMVPRTGERGCSTQANQPFLCVFFWAFNRMDDTHLHWWRWASSSRCTLVCWLKC